MVVGYAGNPLSILDGIFVAIKDDIDCYPHPSKGKITLNFHFHIFYLINEFSSLFYEK